MIHKNTIQVGEYEVESVEEMYWHFAWQQVRTFIVRHKSKESTIIYIWVKDSYNIAFRQIRHFMDYMCDSILEKDEEVERYDFQDIFDYEANGDEDPFGDFLVSIVENKFEDWERTAYNGKYTLKQDELDR